MPGLVQGSLWLIHEKEGSDRMAFRHLPGLAITAIIALSTAAFADEPCKAPGAWFPQIAKSDVDALFAKRPPGDAECDFYQWAYATFLYVTQNDTGSTPRFRGYKSFTELFDKPLSVASAAPKAHLLNLTPRVLKQASSVNDFDGVAQAGLSGVLVDQIGFPIYYAMHFNDDFVNFMTSNGFLDKNKLKNISPATDKNFPTGTLELKSAWRIKPDNISEAEFRQNYIAVDAQIPGLKEATDSHGRKTVVADPDHPKTVLAGLIGLHVVGVIEGHPEFVWASFEHRKNAPNGMRGVDPSSSNPVDQVADWLLYKQGTSYRGSNPTPGTFDLSLKPDGTVAPSTSVYRVYPSGDEAEDEDPQVKDLNGSVQAQLSPGSVISNYKMIGAVWLGQGDGAFGPGLTFSDDLLQGEKQLSNMSMESFTQVKEPNCFSCHNTKASSGMPESRLNVSHSVIKFVQSP